MYRIFAILACMAMLAGCAGSTPERQTAGRPLAPNSLQFPPNPAWDVPPRLVSGDAAIYPISKLLNRKEGYAIVEFLIDVDGATKNIVVIESSDKVFGDHALIAIRDWKFEPAQKNGEAVPVKIRYRSEFVQRYPGQ